MPCDEFDLIIVGAGAAGLMAAREVSKLSSCHWLMLEARDRTGGRIRSAPAHEANRTIDLGAEFVHGEAPETHDLCRSLGLVTIEPVESHALWRASRLASRLYEDPKLWAQLQSAISKLHDNGDPSQSVAQAWRKRRVPAYVQDYVEGFYAADPCKLSLKALKESEQEAGAERHNARIVGGYRELVRGLEREISDLGSRLRLKHELKSLRWKKHKVELDVRVERSRRLQRFCARRVLITLPLGVIQKAAQNRALIVPWPHELDRHLEAVEMGSARKIVCEFKFPFWRNQKRLERSRGGYRGPYTFFHAPGLRFPVWWNYEPLDLAYLSAWVGGRAALELMGMSEKKLTRALISDLAKLFDMPAHALRKELVAVHTHDWDSDPFSCGAYSYVKNPDLLRRRGFARVSDTLYFAGEAWTSDGTVEGALKSAKRAVRAMRPSR
jgi:monoamine oxidase